MPHAKSSSLPQLLLLAAVLVGLAATGARAEVFPIRIGNEAALGAELGTEFRYDDNLFLTNVARKSDFVATAVPGLILDHGKTGATRLHAEARMQFVRYLENDQENGSLLAFSFAGERDAPRTKWSLDGSYDQVRANSQDFQSAAQLVRYDLISGRLNASHELSARTRLDAGLTLYERKFATARFVSSRDVSVPVSLFRAWTPRIGGGLRYHFRYMTYERAEADEYFEHSIGFGTRGDFTSTLSGRVAAAIALRSGDALTSSEQLRLDVSLDWRPDARTTCTLAFSSDTQPSGTTATTYDEVRASIGASRELSPRLLGAVALVARWSDRTRREDELFSATASLKYAVSEDLDLGGQIALEENTSNISIYTYTRTTMSCSATFRF